MADFVAFPIEQDPEELIEQVYDWIEAHFPEWEPQDSELLVRLIEAACQVAAETREVASDVTEAIFRSFGASIMGIMPVSEAYATGNATIETEDDAGYIVEQGTRFTMGIPGTVQTAIFELATDITIPAGSTSTVAGAAVLVSAEPGAQYNGLSDPELLDTDAGFISNTTLIADTAGGTDAEEDEDYLNRLREELTLLTPTPILPNDFAVLARRIPPIVRTVAIDGYDPVAETEDNEKMVTVAAADEAGEVVGAPALAAAKAYLESLRELNFVVHVIDFEYTEIAATYVGTAAPGADPATVEAAVDAALAEFLSPANFDPDVDNKIRYLEVATLINNVAGFGHLTSLTIGVEGGALAAVDVTMDGVAALPSAGTITSTVT
jgi:uncharacterized phage protein gp47/JayE